MLFVYFKLVFINVNLNIFFYFHKLNLNHFNYTNQDEV